MSNTFYSIKIYRMRSTVTCILLLFMVCQSVGQSQKISATFPTNHLGVSEVYPIPVNEFPVMVYLPDGYSDAGDPYPVLFFLHEACGDLDFCTPEMLADHFSTFQSVLDEKIQNGTIKPVVVVMPIVQGPPGTNIYGDYHMYVNSPRNGNYSDVIMLDLLPWAEQNFHIATERNFRAIGGFSAGGYGAFYQGINFSESFGAMIAHSAPLAMRAWQDDILPIVLEEVATSGDNTISSLARNNIFTKMTYGMSTAWSYNLESGFQTFLDLPVNSGQLDEEVFNRWLAFDALRMMQQNPEFKKDIAVYFDAGAPYVPNTNDYSMPGSGDYARFYTDVFDAQLQNPFTGGKLELNYTYQTFSGNHELTANRVEAALLWWQQVMFPDATTPVLDRDPARIAVSVTPNPASSRVVFTYTTPGLAQARINLFTPEGRMVHSLMIPAGDFAHTLSWDPPYSGVFIYQLVHAGGSTKSGMLTVRK